MRRAPRATIPGIGLDVGSESIKLLQLAPAGGGSVKVGAVLRVAIPPDVKGDPDRRVVFAGETVRTALQSGAFSGTRIIAAVPKELLHYKTHRLSAMPADEVTASAKIDARDLFRFDPDSADVQCLDAGEVPHGQDFRREVILVAAGKKYLDDFVRALDAAGAEVASLGIDPCAVWRAALRLKSPDPAAPPRVLLDVGAAQSRLVIGSGEVIHVVKTIAVGADHVRTAIARTLGLTVAEAEQLRRRAGAAGHGKLESMRKVLNDATRHVTELLAREVLAAVRYHTFTFRGHAPKRIELVGGDAHDAQIRSILSATLMLPAKPVELFRGIDTARIPEADCTAALGEWAVALGLAMKGFPHPIPAPPPAADAAAAPAAATKRVSTPLLETAR